MAKRSRGWLSDRTFTVFVWLCGMAGVFLPLSILGYLAMLGIGEISWEFLSTPPGGVPLGSGGGIRPAIAGTLALVGCGLLIAFPCAVGGAIYLSEFCTHAGLRRFLHFTADLLASVPALLYGLWGFSFLVVFCGFGISLRAGILTLAAEMFPIILLGTYASLRAVPAALREAALSLGVSRACIVRRIVLPRAWPGAVAASILAGGHAAGSAAPVIFTASVYFSQGGFKLDAPVMTLPTHLYHLVSEGTAYDRAYATAFVIVTGLLAVNAAALILRRLGRAA